MRPGGELEHLQDWGSKLAGAVARIAGLLHFAEHGPEGIGKHISTHIVASSCALGGYFMEHAKAVFGKTNPLKNNTDYADGFLRGFKK